MSTVFASTPGLIKCDLIVEGLELTTSQSIRIRVNVMKVTIRHKVRPTGGLHHNLPGSRWYNAAGKIPSTVERK